jgi:hypothetical protein
MVVVFAFLPGVEVQAGLIPPGGTYTVTGTNFPGNFGPETVTLDQTAKAIEGGLLTLSETITPTGPNAAWIQFNFASSSGGPLAADLNSNWQVVLDDIPFSQEVLFDNAFIYWTANGTAFSPITPFGDVTEIAPDPIDPSVGPVFFLPAASGEFTSLLVNADVNPYSFLGNVGVDPLAANDFHFAIHVTGVPAPPSWILFAIGSGLFGLVLGARRRLAPVEGSQIPARHLSLGLPGVIALGLAAVLAATPAARAGILTGFAGFTTNGSAAISPDNSTLSLTQGNIGQAASAWLIGPQAITGGFTVQFTYNMTFQPGGLNPADGIAFVLQNDSHGTAALGGTGGGLGYTGIVQSAAVEISIYSDFAPQGPPGTVLNTQGTTGQIGGHPYVSTAPVDVTSQDPIQVALTYDAATTTLTETLLDLNTGKTFTTSYDDNLTTEVGGPTALVGFTGGTGTGTSTQSITSFTFDNTVAAPEPSSVALLGIGSALLFRYGWRRCRD